MRRLLTLAVATTGCTSFDLVRPAESPTSMNAVVSVTHDSVSHAQVALALQTGRDKNGELRAIADSSLYINAVAVPPTRASSRGVLDYGWQSSLGPTTSNPLTVVLGFPKVDGSADTSSIRVEVPVRQDARVIGVDGNGDLRLHVSPFITPAGYVLINSRWDLAVRHACTGPSPVLLTMLVGGDYPSEIRIPRTLIDETNAPQLAACFRAEASYRHASAAVHRAVTIQIDVRWLVNVSP